MSKAKKRIAKSKREKHLVLPDYTRAVLDEIKAARVEYDKLYLNLKGNPRTAFDDDATLIDVVLATYLHDLQARTARLKEALDHRAREAVRS
jgi:hypothetical protein